MNGVELPRPVVYELPDSTLLVADGNHTLDAHGALKHKNVKCTRSARDPLRRHRHAGKSNGSQACRLERQDKRKLVTTWLPERDGEAFTDAVIAKEVRGLGEVRRASSRQELGAAGRTCG